MRGRVGYIDSRRLRVAAVPGWEKVPSIIIPGAMEAYGLFEDFESLQTAAAAADIASGKARWRHFIQNAAVLDMADEPGGVARFTCGGANEDSGQVILGISAGGSAFHLAAGKHLWFEARLKSTNLGTAQINLFAGLIHPVAAAILADAGGALPNNDMLGFVIRDTETVYSFVGDKAAAEDYNGLGIALDTSYHYFGFYVNGVTDVTVFVDRVPIAAGKILTANIPTVGVMPALAIKAGSAAAEVLSVDYVQCVQLR